MSADLSALLLTMRLAFVSTIILLILATPLAYWLANSNNRFKIIIEAMVALPLILPPTVLGFYLLLALAPMGPIGRVTEALGFGTLAFSFSGLVIGSCIYSLPFVVQPLQNSFSAVGTVPAQIAASLGANRFEQWLTVIIPMARNGFLTAAVLGFAHTLGEFGVVLMIGGNIPELTQVISIRIYEQVETLQYAQAHRLSALLLLLSFIMLLSVYALNRRFTLVNQT